MMGQNYGADGSKDESSCIYISFILGHCCILLEEKDKFS
jgi:hypothetical protein